jgi:AraC-like DNA-binding protein
LRLLASRCQLVAGAIADSSSRTLSEDLASLQAAIPEIACLPERLMIRSLIAAVVARVLSDKDLAVSVNLTDAFLAWVARDPSAANWHSDICSLIERCVQALNRVSAPCQELLVGDSRVRRALALLDARFHRPTMSLRMCATEMHLSVWHASRLLKEHTGIGFTEHLHRRRIRAAEALLTDRRLSIKEVAVHVGYVSATQLGRQFKLHMNMTPVQYRRSLHATRSAA